MKKAQRNIEINKVAMIHAASQDDSQIVEDLRTLFVILFVFAIYAI